MHEINLLPPKRRRSLRLVSLMVSVALLMRAVVIGLSILTVAGVVTTAGLWTASYAAGLQSEDILQPVVERFRELRDDIAKRNVVLGQISTLGEERVVWSDFLREFFSVVPTGVTINSLSGTTELVDGEVVSASIVFDGNAITRNTLTIFRERLSGLEDIVSVDSPTTNLLDRNNPEYTFTAVLIEDPKAVK